ncbi:TetR/AcrR family transcriptional regulator [Testudinibacter sp. P27/CKL/0425]
MSKRNQIIEFSYEIFYQNGFHACGVELLAQNAGITKRTLYSYFDGKDDLIAASLSHRHEQFIVQMQETLDAYPPEETTVAYLAFLQNWIESADFYGCMFINACAEYSDAQNPLHQQAKAHKESVKNILLIRFQETGFRQAQTMADLLFIGGEGLIVSAQTLGSKALNTHYDLIRQAVESLEQDR